MPHIKLVIHGVHDVSTWVADADWDQLDERQRRRLLAQFVKDWHERRWPTAKEQMPVPPFRWEVI